MRKRDLSVANHISFRARREAIPKMWAIITLETEAAKLRRALVGVSGNERLEKMVQGQLNDVEDALKILKTVYKRGEHEAE